MKQVIGVIIASLFSLIAFCFLTNKPAARAVDAVVGARAEILTVDDLNQHPEYTAASPNVQPGDYKVTLNLQNNPGFAVLVVRVYLDSNYSPYGVDNVNNVGQSVDYIAGDVLANGLVELQYNMNNHQVGLATAFFNNQTGNGDLISFFIKRNANASIAVPSIELELLRFEDSDTDPLSGNVSSTTTYQLKYILGDINGDGIVDTDDASILLQILSQYGTITSANAQQAFAGCAGMFCDGIFILDAADANQDSGVTQQDSSAILSYYNYVTLELPYSGDIGTCLTYVYTV